VTRKGARHGGTHLQSQLLRKWRQEGHKFEARLKIYDGEKTASSTKTAGKTG
jgi:hypothetical protein